MPRSHGLVAMSSSNTENVARGTHAARPLVGSAAEPGSVGWTNIGPCQTPKTFELLMIPKRPCYFVQLPRFALATLFNLLESPLLLYSIETRCKTNPGECGKVIYASVIVNCTLCIQLVSCGLCMQLALLWIHLPPAPFASSLPFQWQRWRRWWRAVTPL